MEMWHLGRDLEFVVIPTEFHHFTSLSILSFHVEAEEADPGLESGHQALQNDSGAGELGDIGRVNEQQKWGSDSIGKKERPGGT